MTHGKRFVILINSEIIITLFPISSLVLILLLLVNMVHAEVRVFDGLTEAAQKLKDFGEMGVPDIDYNNPTLKVPSLKVEKVVDGLNFSTSMAFLGPQYTTCWLA
jgi:hypothetical protein